MKNKYYDYIKDYRELVKIEKLKDECDRKRKIMKIKTKAVRVIEKYYFLTNILNLLKIAFG